VAIGRLIKESASLVVKVMLVVGVVAVIEVVFIVELSWASGYSMLFYVPYKLLQVVVVLYLLAQMRQLQEGGRRIVSGDLSQPIDTSKMVREFKNHGDNINKMREGISIAVEEQLKSERFKTELITNVSHDIKTPLTSIINYVDLIKKEEPQSPQMVEYIEVLDRQSARLKKLIEDLMEASKASTGNLEVHPEPCDMQVMLEQVVGEFEDKLAAAQLEIVMERPEAAVWVTADGRHLWRVLENLMNNVCKYSQANTRVYVSLEEDDEKAVVVFKNISKSALNIPSEQLMQRFVRGDSSRHTDGSGLGLSIAQSLTELMGGSMTLHIDGDLFKVTLSFKKM
jgi:signal transduction histidine kinase